jgi:hypothetical protein
MLGGGKYQSNKKWLILGLLKIRPESNHSEVHCYLLVKVFVVNFFNPFFFLIMYHILNPYKKILKWNHDQKCIWILMQNPYYTPYIHFKSSLPYDWCMFIEFHPSIYILIQFGNHYPYFCQVDDFTMRLWHLNKVHFVKSPWGHKKWDTIASIYLEGIERA